mmetsp:Transcript_25051/g.94671  ORF Transcript_25051/g.94671 Transcript_25051/m.94671 type:complete len:225 (-) Transcript_25051:112-786(-)
MNSCKMSSTVKVGTGHAAPGAVDAAVALEEDPESPAASPEAGESDRRARFAARTAALSSLASAAELECGAGRTGATPAARLGMRTRHDRLVTNSQSSTRSLRSAKGSATLTASVSCSCAADAASAARPLAADFASPPADLDPRPPLLGDFADFDVLPGAAAELRALSAALASALTRFMSSTFSAVSSIIRSGRTHSSHFFAQPFQCSKYVGPSSTVRESRILAS